MACDSPVPVVTLPACGHFGPSATKNVFLQMSSAPKIVVVGASGFIGKATITHLVKHAEPTTVHVVTRNPTSPAAEEFKKLGVHVVAGDLGAPDSLATPFAGATSVYIIVPATEVRSPSSAPPHHTHTCLCNFFSLSLCVVWAKGRRRREITGEVYPSRWPTH